VKKYLVSIVLLLLLIQGPAVAKGPNDKDLMEGAKELGYSAQLDKAAELAGQLEECLHLLFNGL